MLMCPRSTERQRAGIVGPVSPEPSNRSLPLTRRLPADMPAKSPTTIFPPPIRLAYAAMWTCEPISTPPLPSMNTKSSITTCEPTVIRSGSTILTHS